MKEEAAVEQLSLLEGGSARREKQGKIEEAVYALRQRYGGDSIGTAATFGHELFASEDEEE